MKLNQESKLAFFYRYAYQTDTVPNGFCDYFWNLVLAFIVLPLTWFPILINMLGKKIKMIETMQYSHNIRDYKLVKGYHVAFDITKNSNSFFFVIGLLFIGVFTLLLTHSQMLMGDSKGLFLIVKLYGLGSACVFTGIMIGRLLYFLVMHVYNEMKDVRTEAEIRLKNIKKIRKSRINHEKYWERYDYKQQHPSFFKLTMIAFKSFKNKHCPRIEWVD